MPKSLEVMQAPPSWIQAFSDEIDTLTFGPGFERIEDDTDWNFGVRTGRGAAELKAFFEHIDGELDTEHRLLEFWSGPDQHIVRGEADVKPKGKETAPTTVPFVWIFYMDEQSPERLKRIYIVNGPIRTESVL